MTSFASVDDYKARYGEPADSDRTGLLLEDASALLLSAYEGFWGEDYAEGAHSAFDRAACAVACMVVNRVLTAPAAFAGATQLSQGAGGYTASVSYGSALGEMYLGKSDLKRLGLNVQRMRVLTPYERGEVTE